MARDEGALRSLKVRTSATDQENLLERLDRADPQIWFRKGNGFVGHGCALRLEFHGANRFADAARAWHEVAARAEIIDPLGLPGTGLIALGAFAFDDSSSATSVLTVPRVIYGQRDGVSWVTRVTSGDEPLSHPLSAEPIDPAPQPLPKPSFVPGALSPAGYLESVNQAIALIQNGGVSKVVLARDLVAKLEAGSDLRGPIGALAGSYPDCWTFSVDGFFGSSPETLVSVQHGTVSARVLAGSAARGADGAADVAASVRLATSTKDQDEHEFAVQSVLQALRPHARSVRASEVPFTLKLPNLWHLASDVEGALDDASTSLDLIAALHPTAAVAGTPTPDAVTAIANLEPFDRERYAGPVGWVGADGDGEWAIALRCAQSYPDGRVTAWAGAGVVTDSVAEHELAETKMKFRPILDAFG